MLAIVLRESEYYFLKDDAPEKLSWLGSPAMPSQLLHALQRAALAKQPDIELLPLQPEVQIVAAIVELAAKVNRILRHFMAGHFIAIGTTKAVGRDLHRQKTAAVMQKISWPRILTAANAENVDEMIEQVKLAEAETVPPPSNENAVTQRGGNQQQQVQPLVISMPKSGTHTLNNSEVEELDKILIGGSTRTIPLKKVYLLMRAGCTQFKLVQPGCKDLSNIGLPESLIEFCQTTASIHFGEHDVRMVP